LNQKDDCSTHNKDDNLITEPKNDGRNLQMLTAQERVCPESANVETDTNAVQSTTTTTVEPDKQQFPDTTASSRSVWRSSKSISNDDDSSIASNVSLTTAAAAAVIVPSFYEQWKEKMV
jgi:hypothetical protein